MGIAVSLLCGILLPDMMRRPYRVVEAVLGPVGKIMAGLVLAVAFFCVFTPYAFVLRIIGWDPMRVRSKTPIASAWHQKACKTENIHYKWQY